MAVSVEEREKKEEAEWSRKGERRTRDQEEERRESVISDSRRVWKRPEDEERT